MTQTEVLNSLIHNLAKYYFSKENYHNKGYVYDWLINAATELNKSFIRIDILNKRIRPSKMEIEPLMIYLKRLEPVLDRILISNKMPDDYLKEAVFELTIDKYKRKITCDGYVIDKYDRRHRSEPYEVQSFKNFRVFYPPVIEKVINLYKKVRDRFSFFRKSK